MSNNEKLAILDAGAQYGKVIDRRSREFGVESIILPLDTPSSVLKNYKAIIISGSSNSVDDDNAPKYDPNIFSLDIPVLGVCYGMQLMNYSSGGKVIKGTTREDGPCTIDVNPDSSLFSGLDKKEQVLMSHGDSVTPDTLAPGFKAIAFSNNNIIAAIENPSKKLYGVQFHPEVDLSLNGKKIIKNFLYSIAGFSGDYTVEDRQKQAIDYIQNAVGNKKVLMLVSGGVDSTVCAVLLAKAIDPKNIYALHIDNGFMRKDESVNVKKILKDIGVNIVVVDASNDFYNGTSEFKGRIVGPLKKITNSEEKRAIIGDTFMRVSKKAIQDLKLDPKDVILAQGTLRPDLIESASHVVSGNAATIKTHHNDTPEVRKLRDEGRVIEPLKDYHKDEVRALGASLGIPIELVWRQPFPGPGLAVRIICADKPFITDDFDAINESLKQYCSTDLSVTLLPIQTVGVQGDGRTYSYLAAISGKKDWGKLFALAQEIPKKIHQINRVAYIFGPKVDGPIKEITQTYLDVETIKQLQTADDIANKILFKHSLVRTLSQVPIVSFPIAFSVNGNRSIAIRTFITNDFMTGVPALPGKDIPEEVLEELVNEILKNTPNISRIAYDLTSKPPGTTEWE